jgi:hypothetical protein
MPKDTAIMMEMTRDLRALLRRRMDYLHLPVPKDRTAYFAPLGELSLPAEAALYRGLIHEAVAAGDSAHKVVSCFGVATACGWSRTDQARVPGLLAAHRNAMSDAAC